MKKPVVTTKPTMFAMRRFLGSEDGRTVFVAACDEAPELDAPLIEELGGSGIVDFVAALMMCTCCDNFNSTKIRKF